jgi:hypothetical protein
LRPSPRVAISTAVAFPNQTLSGVGSGRTAYKVAQRNEIIPLSLIQ